MIRTRMTAASVAALALAGVIAATPALAVAPQVDYSSLTDAELQQVVDSARNEQATRALTADGDLVLADADGLKLYLTGEYAVARSGDYIYFDAALINDAAFEGRVIIDDAYINGWEVYASDLGSVAAGKKRMGQITFSLRDAGIDSADEIDGIELHLRTYRADRYETLTDLGSVIIEFDPDEFELAD